MQKVQLQIADIETATHLNLVTTIYQDEIVTSIKKNEKKHWISRMEKGLKLTGLIFETKFLPRCIFITDIDDKDYTFNSKKEVA